MAAGETKKLPWAVLAPALTLALALLAWPPALAAQEDGGGLRGALGLAVAGRPEFEGSDKYEAQVRPVLDLRYGRAFLSASRGLGLEVVSARDWVVAPALRYQPGRDEDDSELLRGLGDLDGGAEIGGLVAWRPGPFSLTLAGYQGLGTVDGLTLELGAKYGLTLTDRLKGSVGAEAVFANRAYNRRHFGVTAAQSERSRAAGRGYEVYDPSAGVKHASLLGGLSYDLTETVALGLSAEYKRLTGPAADSPLVKRGSADQFISGLSVTYNFQ